MSGEGGGGREEETQEELRVDSTDLLNKKAKTDREREHKKNDTHWFLFHC